MRNCGWALPTLHIQPIVVPPVMPRGVRILAAYLIELMAAVERFGLAMDWAEVLPREVTGS